MELTAARDKVVVITGASRGLGAGMAEECVRHGVKLGLCARSQPVLGAHPDVLARRLDVTDAGAVERFAEAVVERHGGIDLWINNAGVLEPIKPLRDVTTEELEAHLRVNVLGVFHGMRAYVRYLRAAGRGGVLVSITSGAAEHGYAGWSAYCAGKAAVNLMTECVELEERDAGLRAYAVAPGVVDTDMQAVIRATPRERFPAIDKFLKLKQQDAFNSPAFVARRLLAIAFDPKHRPKHVIVRLPNERP